jgi:hypothetical protein
MKNNIVEELTRNKELIKYNIGLTLNEQSPTGNAGKNVSLEPCNGGGLLNVGHFNITINGQSPVIGDTLDPTQYGSNLSYWTPVGSLPTTWANVTQVEVKSVMAGNASQTVDFNSSAPCTPVGTTNTTIDVSLENTCEEFKTFNKHTQKDICGECKKYPNGDFCMCC